MRHYISFMLSISCFILFMSSCEDDYQKEDSQEAPLVVEGWIMEGEQPVVMVTHAIHLDRDTADFSNFIEKWGRVSIYDGDQQYFLTGHINSGYLPSLYFTTSRLTGKSGHTYRLKVETEQGDAEAESTLIQSDVTLSIEAEPVDGSESEYIIRAYASDLIDNGYYKFYIKEVGKDKHFYPSFKGTFMGESFPKDGFVISRMQRIQFDTDEENRFTHYFAAGDIVQVRLCRIPEELYEFWRIYDNSVALGSNMLLSFIENCPGNVEGAYGYWQASSSTTRVIRIP